MAKKMEILGNQSFTTDEEGYLLKETSSAEERQKTIAELPISNDDILNYARKVETALDSFEPRNEDNVSIIEEFEARVAYLIDILFVGKWLPPSDQLNKLGQDLREGLIALEELSSTRRINRKLRFEKIAAVSEDIEAMLEERVASKAKNSDSSAPETSSADYQSGYQSGISDALTNYNRELVADIEASLRNLENQVEKAKQTNELLQSQFEKTSSDLQASSRDQLAKFQEETVKMSAELETKVKEKLEKIDESVAVAEELKHYAQGKALSGFFADRATAEKKSAENWTYLTWAFAITTLAAIGVIFYFQLNNFVQNQQADLSLLGTKVLFTATLGLVAKWTSKRANRHLADESKYHRLAINLKTIDSFIDKLKPESKDEILKAVALKTFTEINGNETATDFETASVLDVIKSVLPKADGK